MDDDGSHDPPRRIVIQLWPGHFDAVAVFQRCDIHVVGAGMGGLYWTGITAREVRAALALQRVPLARRADVAEDVQYMGAAVAEERNRRAKAEVATDA